MAEASIGEPLHRPRIRRVLVGPDERSTVCRNHATKEFFDAALCRVRIGSPELPFKHQAFQALSRSHRATSPEFRIAESVHEMGNTDQEIQVHRPVLAVFECAEPVEDNGLDRGLLGPSLFVEQQAVSTEALAQELNGGMGDPGFSCDLAEPRAGDETMKDGLEEVTAAEPVGR